MQPTNQQPLCKTIDEERAEDYDIAYNSFIEDIVNNNMSIIISHIVAIPNGTRVTQSIYYTLVGNPT